MNFTENKPIKSEEVVSDPMELQKLQDFHELKRQQWQKLNDFFMNIFEVERFFS